MTISTFGRRSRTVVFALIALLVGAAGFSSADAVPANAVEATTFNAGNIISDGEFYDGRAMSSADVQNFLNQQVPKCRIGSPGYMPGALSPSGSGNIIASNCMKDFRITTLSRPADAYCGAYVGVPNETAAQVIFKVGAACGISQRVLLVMLQKEQSLVTDTWPVTRQYNFAMGMNCPDSGPNNSANCNTDSAGFYLQVMLGARQLKVYRANPGSYNYQPFRNNTILWHPNRDCGSSQVYIENWATAALYIYTPYRPNQAALNAGWGQGDGCSSYGNRNFYLRYNDWFGDRKPIGDFNSAVVESPGQLRVRGWAIDPDTTAPLGIQVNVGSTVFRLTANQSRADVGAVYPSYGDNHGFDQIVDVSALAGEQEVCLHAVNTKDAQAVRIRCHVVNVSLPAGKRVSGSFRYETSVAISKNAYPTSSSGTVVVATGTDFPDSLSAAPLAAKLGAPILLTDPNGLPGVVRDEIIRLAPSRVVIIGGENAVSPVVEQDLLSVLPQSSIVERVAGADRFGTSLAVIRRGWDASDSIFIATSSGFADALSAGAAAGTLGAPVLLVAGGELQAYPQQVEAIETLGVSQVFVSGGTAAISDSLVNSVSSNRQVTRFAGADRYETSARIGEAFGAPGEAVFLASGLDFADALSGAAVAPASNATLLLASKNCVPSSVRAVQEQIRPSSIVILGGAEALSEAVRLNLPC